VLNDQEKQVLLWLASVDGVGEKTLRAVLAWRAKTAQNLLEVYQHSAWPVELFATRQAWENVSHLHSTGFSPENYQQKLHSLDLKPLFVWDDLYPTLLKETAVQPTIIYCRGKIELLAEKIPIAVVGTRQITPYGRKATSYLVEELVALGAVIVSGFMYGVDVVAHQAALNCGGKTIAVLGFGHDQMYPASQASLYQQMLQQNALFISHFPPGVKARPGNFLQRNQIVAGLTRAVVVTEAGFPSGSFSTAQAALNEGRTVCAVPGPFNSEFSQGTKWLINEGAVLVTAGDQVLSEIGLSIKNSKNEHRNTGDLSKKIDQLTELEKTVFETILTQDGEMDQLILQTQLSLPQLTAILSELELKGLIFRSGDYWQVGFN